MDDIPVAQDNIPIFLPPPPDACPVAVNAACTFGCHALLRFGGGFHLLRSEGCPACIPLSATSTVGGANAEEQC